MTTREEPVPMARIEFWFDARLRAAGGSITDVRAFTEEVVRWAERQHGISFDEPVAEPGHGAGEAYQRFVSEWMSKHPGHAPTSRAAWDAAIAHFQPALTQADDQRELAAAPQAPSGQQAEPTDEQLIALNAGERFFSESPTKYPEARHGTQYHAGAPGVLGFARAAIALAGQQSEPAPAGQAVGEPITINGEPATAQSLLAALIDIYDDAQNNHPEHRCYIDSAWSDALKEARQFLAASQAERPAVKEDGNG